MSRGAGSPTAPGAAPSWPAAAAIDGLLLGLFMISAATFGTALEWHGSPLHAALPHSGVRRALMGLLMGATAVLLIRSPLGQRSGAHMNPGTTLVFARLGRVPWRMALGYALAQFAGGAAGLWLPHLVLGRRLAATEVHYVATLPGAAGVGWAFATEVAMTFVLLSVVLRLSQSRRWNRLTPWCAGALVAIYIAALAPLSGMSLNPARTLASAVWAGDFRALWLYFTAPVLGMVLAAEWFVWGRGLGAVRCAKLHHDNGQPCTFRCRWGAAPAAGGGNV